MDPVLVALGEGASRLGPVSTQRKLQASQQSLHIRTIALLNEHSMFRFETI